MACLLPTIHDMTEWLWVRRAAPSKEDTNRDAATEEAIELRELISTFPSIYLTTGTTVEEMTKRVEDIQACASYF